MDLETLPKILIVDDEPNNLRVYERTLASLNVEIIKALSGQQALAVAHKHDFALILMDVQMPCMDGFETAALILDHPKTSHIPVIFITAFARDETFEFKGYASGAVDYLVKPINEDVVRSKVAVFLELHKEKQLLNIACKVREKAEAELRVHKEHLEELVKERTQELQNSIENLMATQNKLLESEKMASLGRLVAGVAHELNTPIGISITGASFLQEKLQQLKHNFKQGKISRKDLADFVDSAPKSVDIILTNLDRAAEQISNFKLVAVDQTSERKRNINLLSYIQKVVNSLSPAINKAQHTVEVTGDQTIKLNTIPGGISQIITNLIMNSIVHAYQDDEQGKMLITVKQKHSKVLLTYTDYGQGMEKSVSQMVFEPFFTTTRGSGGSGLGMYIVYNLVNQGLGGKITCLSKLGQGTQFIIEFPIHHNKDQQ
ncbi:hybrid sensor histidine kinase/response regulator [Colwellia sp. MT41]|uniref:histidine kinase n=1 Tax=Colwellia marinimaniae TaxID=1513592 RepID=A0ABQ0MTZ6_9GAMM|nr:MULTISPECIES: hybrid sensor histidine kinase/response regulator [Colwellia]ALO33737.1 hybrid sensor histidine kinase/response regulator [Colwellia sp. MT41]GAW95830.1 PAS domain-containing sensor histidine kinase [Colwellia marinimaniae]